MAMNSRDFLGNIFTNLGEVTKRTSEKTVHLAKDAAEYINDHRTEIREGATIATESVFEAVKSVGQTIYDTASLRIYSAEKVADLKSRMETQAREYGHLTAENPNQYRTLDSFVLGGDLLSDILANGASDEVKEAYAAAYPQESQYQSFEDAVRNQSDEHLQGFLSGIKGKLFELRYEEFLNDGNLPDGYHAELANSATQPGWDLSIHGPDGHIAELLQLKATDSVSYVHQALERYPDIQNS